MPQRCITFEATEADAVSEPIHSGVLAERVRSAAASIVRHVAAVSHEAAIISRAVLHFQLGSDDALYFLYATSLRLQPISQGVQPAVGPRGGLEVGRLSRGAPRASEPPAGGSRPSASAAAPRHRARDDPLVPRAALPAVLSQPKALKTGLDLDPRYVVPRHTDGAPRMPTDSTAAACSTMRSGDGSSSEDASAFRLGGNGTLNSTALTGLHALPTLMGRTITAKVVVPPAKHVSSIPPLQRAAARAAKHENLVARARARTASAAAAATAWDEAAEAPRRATEGDAVPPGGRPLLASPSTGELRRKTADPSVIATLAAPKPRRTDGHDPVSWRPSSRGSPLSGEPLQSGAVARRTTGSGTTPSPVATSAYGKLTRGSGGAAPQRASGGVAARVQGGRRKAQPDPAIAAAAIDAAVAQAQAALEAGDLHGVELPEKVAELLRRTSITLDEVERADALDAQEDAPEPAADETAEEAVNE